MLFNSFEFALFLPIVFLLYWFVFNKTIQLQNIFLLLVGYVFYGWWDWRFLFLIAFSTLFDFAIGLLLEKQSNANYRKLLFLSSCIVNIGLLFFFKYFNFFADSFITLLQTIGYQASPVTLKIILPVGISFYTFQSLSYTADIYKRKMSANKNLITFAAFISFFPQLVAGPIERAFNLLPQFTKKRTFNSSNAVNGMQQILWGLFKKIVIADTLSGYIDSIFTNYNQLPGSTLFLGAIYFAVQIYCDFSGYSSIAIGTAKLFGFSLMQNFNYPYFSKSVAEFWRKWHISLTTWFRDYVYIPLGGSRGPLIKVILNTLLVFIISGFWHGANFTFIIWGLLNGLFIIPSVIYKKKEIHRIQSKSPIYNGLAMVFTFLLITLTWIFFRAKNISQAFDYLNHLASKSLFTYPINHGMAITLPLIGILFLIEWLRFNNYKITQTHLMPKYIRWSTYLVLIIVCLAFFKQNQSFIYFQF